MSDLATMLNWVNDAIFVSLVNTTLQMTFLIPLIAFIIWMFRIKSAATRHALWLFILFAIIVLPFLTPLIPQANFARLYHRGASDGGPGDLMQLATGGSAGEFSEGGDSAPSASVANAGASTGADVSLINPVSIAYFIWCAGALSLLCITIGAYGKLRKVQMGSIDLADSAVLDMFAGLRRKVGVGRSVAVRASSEVYAPISLGIFSPTIILPDGVTHGGSNDQLEMILTHELAHIKRFDYLINFLQNALRAVFFFHPLFHLMNRNLAREREHICDDWVIDLTKRRSAYAECLLGLLEREVYRPVNVPVTVAMAERKQDIPGRIDMIVDKTRKTATKVSRKALIVILVLGCLSLPVIRGIGLVRFAGAQAPEQVQIVFQSDRDGNYEVYVMDADGKNQRNITNHPATDRVPAWSPDGTTIAFISNRDAAGVEWAYDIYVMDADGKNQRRLTNNPAGEWYPAWSPDGQSIAFCSKGDRGNFWGIYVMDPDGKNQRRLTDDPAWGGSEDLYPAWSPDGQMIAFYSTADENEEIYVMDADGKNHRRLTNSPAWDAHPAWSPDGQSIAFISEREGDENAEVYIMDADGKNQRNITNHPATDMGPAWSPDSTIIAFSSDRDAAEWVFDIYVMDANGKNLHNITDHPADDSSPDFHPAFVYPVSPAGKLKSTWGRIRALLRPH